MGRLTSGKTYSLEEIFSGENDKVIIPDLQRDYCWGNPLSSNREDSLTGSFLDTLLKLDREKDITMGLIYGYYDELKPYHMQLCDGQQRLTTLFLILGMLNRKCGDNRYKTYLVSDFEWDEDDKEPHLLYGIRESSIYFLSDLTSHFFVNNKLALSQVREQFWFLNAYNQDPTINSMISALGTIESKLEDVDDCGKFGDFLVKHIKFLFYDTIDRQNGEETFVTINTTGEPLSANQNLKPLIIMNNKSYKRKENDSEFDTAHDWEIMETWFWQKRRRDNKDTSTEGMLAFLHCVRVIHGASEKEWHDNIETDDESFPYSSIRMDYIWKCFIAYKRMYELNYKAFHIDNVSYPKGRTHYTQESLYALLPTMEYCMRYANADDLDIQRVFHLFTNMARYRRVFRSSQNESLNVPAFRAFQMIEQMESKDILSLLQVPAFNNIEEERKKLQFIKDYSADQDTRSRIENLFSDAESFPIYVGQIATLVDWSQSVEQLEYYYDKVKGFNPDSCNYLRRALLAFNMDDYPLRNYTLCSGKEWRELFEKQSEKMKEFLNLKDLDEIIDSADEKSIFYPIIKKSEYLDFCQDHKIRIHPNEVLQLMEKTRASANYIFFHNGEVFKKRMIDMTNWSAFDVWTDGQCSVFFTISKKFKLTLDIRILVSENEIDGYEIVAWLDRNQSLPSFDPSLLKDMGFKNNSNNELAYPIIASVTDAKQRFIEITKLIDDIIKTNSD